MPQQHDHGAQARLAVSTVIFALSPDDGRGRPEPAHPARAPHSASPAPALGAARRLAARRRRRSRPPPPARSPRPPASRRTTSSSSTRSATPTAPPTSASSRSCTGRSCSPTRPSAPSPTRTCAGSPRTSCPSSPSTTTRIVDYALWRLRTKLEYSRIAHAFLGETFTLAELREVHEAVLQRRLDPANFRRTMEASGTLVDTGERLAGAPHRPPALYRYDTGAGPAASDRPAHHRTAEDEPMTIAPPTTRDADRDARRGIRRPHHPAHRDGRDGRARPARPTSRRARGSSTRGPAGYGPGSSMGDVIPTGSPRQGALPEPVPRRRRTPSCTTASAPRRRPSATASSCSATSTSATRSSSTPTSWATRSSSRTPRSPGPTPRRSCSAACTSWPRPPTCCRRPSRP